jgi:hypothetical protein
MKQTDAPLVQKWHNDVVPFLMNCLDTYLGSCYTASLVRQGASERDSKVVVRIQCQRMPAPNARSSIQTQICKKFDTNPAGETIRVKFLKRELVYLSGGTGFDDMEEEEEEEEELFPYYKLYWKHPGMGASVGMLPDCESRTATLGCWIHIEKELYLLTVKHLIGKQVLKDFVDGKSPCLQVTSPSHGVLEKLEGDLAHFRRQITEDMGEEIRKIAPEGGLLKQEDAQNSKTLDTLLSQNDKIKEHLDECYLDPQAYLIGTVKFWSDPEAVRQPLSSQNPKFGHAMDWAACKAGHRFGANKHRYRYVGEEYEGVYWDIDNKWGAGNIVHGVAPISENDKVYFVGSTSGRVDATVHSAGIAVDSKGIKSLEWALIPSSKQQKEAAKYRGDSGAAVIRNSDNALVAHLWGAVDEPALLLITPMEDVFADIKAKSGTDKVSLATYPPEPRPVSPVPVTEYTQLCSRKSNTQLRSQRRKVNLSSIPLRPKNAPPTPNTLPVSPSTTGPLMITSNAIQGPPRPLLNLFDTLTTILPSPAKNPSFVSSIPAGDMSRTASPLTRILFKFPSSVKQNITLHRIMSSARPKHPYASARSVRTYQKTHNITKRPKVINAY